MADLAVERELLSIRRGLDRLVEDIVGIVASARSVILPFGPRHALALNAIDSLCLPGRYDRPAEDAKLHNTLTRLSSRDWAVWRPGMDPQVLDAGEIAELVVESAKPAEPGGARSRPAR